MKIGLRTNFKGKRLLMGYKDHGDGEEVLLDLRMARELPEAVQHHDRRIGLRPLPRLFARPLHQGEGHRRGGKDVPGELTRGDFPP
jgi:hypothetical protein